MKTLKEQAAEFEARAEAIGVSMHAVMKRAGLAYPTWWNIQNGKRSPRHETLADIDTAIKGFEAEFKAGTIVYKPGSGPRKRK